MAHVRRARSFVEDDVVLVADGVRVTQAMIALARASAPRAYHEVFASQPFIYSWPVATSTACDAIQFLLAVSVSSRYAIEGLDKQSGR